MPRPIAGCSTPMAGSRTMPPRSSGCGARGATPRRPSPSIAPRSSGRRREADWLRHAVEELRKLKPEAGEETALAERRTAHDAGREGRGRPARRARRGGGRALAGAGAVGGGAAAGAPRRAGAGAGRARGEGARRGAQRARRGARPSGARACASPITIRSELERIEERLFALRAAGRKYNSPVDALDALAEKYAGRSGADRCRRRAARRAGEGREGGRRRALPRTPRSAVGRAQEGRGEARQGGQRRIEAAQARAREILHADRERRRGGRARTASTASSSGCRPIPARGRAR